VRRASITRVSLLLPSEIEHKVDSVVSIRNKTQGSVKISLHDHISHIEDISHK
jgi:hypothetical protein